MKEEEPEENTELIGSVEEGESFVVDSKDLFDKEKNPNLSLSPREILKNPKIKKRKL